MPISEVHSGEKVWVSERPISRVLFRDRSRGAVIPLRPPLPTVFSNLPGNGRALPKEPWAGRAARITVPLFGLAPHGVYRASRRHRRSGALLPHPFTLTGATEAAQAVYSLLHFPSRRRASPLASILPVGARTFLPPDLLARAATAWNSPIPGAFYRIVSATVCP